MFRGGGGARHANCAFHSCSDRLPERAINNNRASRVRERCCRERGCYISAPVYNIQQWHISGRSLCSLCGDRCVAAQFRKIMPTIRHTLSFPKNSPVCTLICSPARATLLAALYLSRGKNGKDVIDSRPGGHRERNRAPLFPGEEERRESISSFSNKILPLHRGLIFLHSRDSGIQPSKQPGTMNIARISLIGHSALSTNHSVQIELIKSLIT